MNMLLYHFIGLGEFPKETARSVLSFMTRVETAAGVESFVVQND